METSPNKKTKLPLPVQIVLFLAIVGFIWAQRTYYPAKPDADKHQPEVVDPSQEDPSERPPVAYNPVEPTEPAPEKSQPEPSQPLTTAPATKPPGTSTKPPPKLRTGVYVENEIAHNVQLKDVDGNVLYHGDITLTSTLDRISRDEIIDRFQNDGSIFSNRERRLPNKINGYYTEWVHPTQGIGGPGPQRIITGKGNEIFYTPDHYGHFYPVKRK